MYGTSKESRVRPTRPGRKPPLADLFSMVDRSSFLILLGPCLFVWQTFYFDQQAAHFRVLPLLCSLFPCLVFGAAALIAEHLLDRLAGLFRLRCNPMLSIFLLFFILLVGYLLLTSLLISTPMAFVLAKSSFSPGSINHFTLQNSSCALVLALGSWLRRLLSFMRKPDGHSMLHLRLSNH